MDRSRRWTTSLAAGLLVLLFVLLTLPLGLFGLTTFLLPVPIVYVYLQEGWVPALVSAGVAAFVGSLVLGPVLGLGLLVTALVPGVVMGEGLRTGEEPFRTVGSAAGLVLLAIAAFLLVSGLALSHGQDPLRAVTRFVSTVEATLAAAEGQLKAAYQANGLSAATAGSAARAMIENIRLNVLPVLPAIVSLSVLANETIAYALARMVLRRRHDLPVVRPFVEWEVPLWLPPIFLLATIAMMWLGGATRPLVLVAENVFILAGTFLAVDGLSVLYYGLQRIRAGKTLSILALVAAILVPLSLALLAWLGVADSLTDFRRLRQRQGG